MGIRQSIATFVRTREKQRELLKKRNQEKEKSLAEVCAFLGKDMDLAAVNQLVFGGPWDMSAEVDVLIVLGCWDCEARVLQAYESGKHNPKMLYVVSGGVPCMEEDQTEAEFMAGVLRVRGIPEECILLENQAQDTRDNIIYSEKLLDFCAALQGVRDYRVGIVTSQFHIVRSKRLVESMGAFRGHKVFYFPAYDHDTSPEHWYDNPAGRKIILNELRLIRKIK